ncbi:MAG TPA: peptidylprolyl isomerase [Acidisarcina sp.]
MNRLTRVAGIFWSASRLRLVLLTAALICCRATGLLGQSAPAPPSSPAIAPDVSRNQQTTSQPSDDSAAATAPQGSAQELDKVIAIINGDVLLQSDVIEEMQFASIQPLTEPGMATSPALAGRRLISRTLILQQMKRQQADTAVSDEELQKGLADLRRQIPACARQDCQSEAGWRNFLKSNNLSEEQVNQRWRQRIEIVRFIDIRFRNGIRITKPEIQAYYEKTFIPAFRKESTNPPALDAVSSRIEEILLQQRVSTMLQDWLKSLRDQGSVQILDPMYGTSSESSDDSGGAS